MTERAPRADLVTSPDEGPHPCSHRLEALAEIYPRVRRASPQLVPRP